MNINVLLIPQIKEENTLVCEEDKAIQHYEVLYPIPNSFYQWEVNHGAIIDGQGTPYIQVAWDDLGMGNLQVSETNESVRDTCFGTSEILEIEVVKSPDNTIKINGDTQVCAFEKSMIYSLDGLPQSTYQWEVKNVIMHYPSTTTVATNAAISNTITTTTRTNSSFSNERKNLAIRIRINLAEYKKVVCFGDSVLENVCGIQQ